MKKFLLGSGLALLSGLLHAQPPAPGPVHDPMQGPPPIAVRWTHDSTLIGRHLKLAADKLQQLQPAFSVFYKNIDALVADERPRPPRFVDVEKLVKQRDAVVLRALSKEEGEDFLRMEHLLQPPPPAQQKDRRNDPPPSSN